MIELLIKSSVAIALAQVFYKLVLQQESYFATNRFYLLSCIVQAFALPYLSLLKIVEQQGYLARIFQKHASEEGVSKMAFSERNVSTPVIKQKTESSLPLKERGFNPVVTTPSEVKPTAETHQPERLVTDPEGSLETEPSINQNFQKRFL